MPDTALSRPDASAAVHDLGWRLILTTLRTVVAVKNLREATGVATLAMEAAGPDAGAHLSVDLRAHRVELSLQSAPRAVVTARDAQIAAAITAALTAAGHTPGSGGAPRVTQLLEIAFDTMDAAAIRPFWKAVLGYVDEGGTTDPAGGLADPVGQGPTVWFQRLDQPREQRNRIHFDVSVPHEEAERRIRSALSAGGRLVSDASAPAFWILADADGNEICVCTWQGRD
jgi:4a-hydroxytetrahydrobiopterin dehydratase